MTNQSNTISSGVTIEALLTNKIPNHLQLHDNMNKGLNIIYFGKDNLEIINKQFIINSEQYIRPPKYTFLKRVYLRQLPLGSTKQDSQVLSKQLTSLKTIINKPIIFDLEPLYQPIIHLLQSSNKNQIKEAFELTLNSIEQDFIKKGKDRKTILLINEDSLFKNTETINMAGGTGTSGNKHIYNFLDFLKYLITFNLSLNIQIDGIVYYNSNNNTFYPLTLLKHNRLDNMIFNKQSFITLIKDLNIITDIHEINKIFQDDFLTKEISNKATELKDAHKQELEILLKQLEDKDFSNLETGKKEAIIRKINEIAKNYKGATLEEKLANIYNPEQSSNTMDSKPVAKTSEKNISIANTKTINNTLAHLQTIYNGSIDLNELEPHFQKQLFNPLKITKLDSISGINKQKTEMFEKLDTNIKQLMEALKQDPELNLEIVDIKNKLVETNKDRFFEYSVKIKHKFENTSTSPYSLKFRIPAPINDKYLKIGGNNYIMIQQMFPKPVQKVSNTVCRLYTHYNTTSVILKGSKLESKDFKTIETDFINKLNINPSKKMVLDQQTEDKLLEYGCPLSVTELMYKYIQF